MRGQRVLAVCRGLVAIAAGLVPSIRRAEWRREWNAELVAWSAENRGSTWHLVWRSILAFGDALEVRRLDGVFGAEALDGRLERRADAPLLSDALSDLRIAGRSLRVRPIFACVAILTLGLGIGATTLISSVAWTVLLKPPVYSEPERVVDVWPELWWSKHLFDRLEHESTSYEALMVWAQSGHRFVGTEGSSILRGPDASAGMLEVLGQRVALGRDFDPADTRNASGALLLTHEGWQRRFGGDPGIVGRLIELNDRPIEVVGVLAPGADVLQARSDVVTAAQLDPDASDWRAHYMHVVGRLKPGVTAAQASEEIRRLADSWRADEGRGDRWGQDAKVLRLDASRVEGVRPTIMLLFAAVICLLLVAAANVANLWIARALERQNEITMRAVLGARPWRLIRQTLTETAVIACLGGWVGVAVAYGGLELMRGFLPADLPNLDALSIDGRSLGVALLFSFAIGCAMSMAPAWATARRGMKPGTRGASSGRRTAKLRSALVAAEVTLAVVLLVGAGVLLKSFSRAMAVDLGFDPRGVLTLVLLPDGEQHANGASLSAYYEGLHQSLQTVPGVTSVSLIHAVPVQNPGWNMEVYAAARPPGAGEDGEFAAWRPVTAEYFTTAGIPILEGRGFGGADHADSASVALLNRTAADRLFPTGDAIGAEIRFPFDSANPIRVVGIVGDVKIGGPRQPAPLAVYRPFTQTTAKLHDLDVTFRSVMLRGAGDPAAIAEPVYAAIRAYDPGVAIDRVMTMDAILSDDRADERLSTFVVTLFALVGLVLGAVGIFGIMEYAVRERGRELSIRMALGASKHRVVRLVLATSARLVGAGLALGMLIALVAGRVLEGQLFEVSVRDPQVYATVMAILALVALVATWWPARRASKSDPVDALRSE